MLLRCIDSVLKSTYPKIEIVICEDPSTNEARESILNRYSRYKNIIYIKNKTRLLKPASLNKAIRASKGTFLFHLDDDNVVHKKCITELVSTMHKFPKVGVVEALAFYYSHQNIIMHAGTERSRFMRGYQSPFSNERWRNQFKEGYEIGNADNAYMIRKKAIKAAGMYDLLSYYNEGAELQARIKKAGYSIVINPKAKTYHDVPYRPISNARYLFSERVNRYSVYHIMYSKILYEFRYEKTVQKLTFLISLPLYLGFYVDAIITKHVDVRTKFGLIGLLLKGTARGFVDAARVKQQIEYL